MAIDRVIDQAAISGKTRHAREWIYGSFMHRDEIYYGIILDYLSSIHQINNIVIFFVFIHPLYRYTTTGG